MILNVRIPLSNGCTSGKSRLRVYWLTCVLAMAAAAASATTIIMPTDEQLVAKSPLIVQGTVVSTRAVSREGRIWTETKLAVEQTLKGSAAGTIIIREIGGEVEGRISKIYGAPSYEPGQRVMAFLTPTPRGDYQTMDLFVGKFAEARMMNGERLWVRDDVVDEVHLLDASFHPIAAKNVQRAADSFEAFVRDRVLGRKAMSSYGVENPVLQESLAKPGEGKIKANFTLLSEPSIYRWFVMDSGGNARWFSYGTQAGYAGGGANEVQTAMNAWNGYGSAKINYTYGGAGSGSPGGVSGSPNGVNEVLFNDVNNDIAGSFTGSGVVGLGGFNGVSGAQSWTSTFAADAQHPQRTYTAYNIVEGNLAIQDGVSPTIGVSSSRLAEIVAHEFGHTLGFGHSSDGTALMFASLVGLGPSLRSDDQLAARWLYPNGSAATPPPPPPTVTVPAAPSNVRASWLGGGSVSLQWNDNSNNESGFYVYLAYLNGTYTRVGSTGANVIAAQLNGASPGSYQVYVASFNSGGEAGSSATTVDVPQPAPSINAAFSVSPGSGIAGSTLFSFSNQSTGPFTSSLWQFGDGATSSAANPTHIYAGAGSYTVILAVSGSGQQSQTNRLVSVAAPAPPPAPPVGSSFSFGPASPKVGETVSFTDQSSGSPTQWFWWFGDGATSTTRNPQHAYATPGTYTITVQVWNATTTSSTSRSLTVQAYAPFRSLVSAAAQTAGIGNSVWRTELTLFNAGNDAASGQYLFIPGAGGTVVTRPLYLAPKQSITYANALPDLFGIGSGTGAMAIEATSAASTPDIKITSRTFTTGSTGTYGQAVPQIGADDLQQTLYVTGIESNADYRTNLGLVNRSGLGVGVALTLFASNGATLANATVTVPANNFQQGSLASYFPAVANQSRDGMTVRAAAGSAGAISVYASVINNKTQDPIYIQGIAPPSSSRIVIPAVGRAPGIGGTYWRSDVTVMNPNAFPVRISWRYLPAGTDNTAAGWSALNLAAGETRVLRDVASLFGVQSGTGALELAADGFVAPVVSSRTYTSTADGGTYGQSIDPVMSYRADAYVPGLRVDSSYRSNVGFYNNSNTTTGVTARLVNLYGQEVASAFVSVPAHAPVQFSLAALFPNVNLASYSTLTLHAHTDGGAILFGYASVVDNASGDPVFFAAQ
ncbi:MAG: PKD domain-containing protein [Acidobacteriota bacterium]